jgi:hypothetical protein
MLGTQISSSGQFEEWELDHTVLLPTRSELYYLRPAGLGTSFIESLTSYIARLAEQHCLTTRSLIVKKLLPSLDRPYLSGQKSHDSITAFWKDASTLNGANILTAEWVQVTGKLTLYPDLHLLTMLPWADVLSPKGLVRHSQAWCPFCYEEWNRGKAVVYNPLIWSLEVVSICPLHNIPLHRQCPYEDCNRLIPMLAPRSRVGYCPHCGRWLGRSYTGEAISAATFLDRDDEEWQQWVVAKVAELISSASQLQLPLQKDHFAKAVATYLDEVAGGNISAAARLFQVSRRTIRDWKNGVQIPQLSSLLRFCHLCGISPLQLLTESSPAAEYSSTSRIISAVSGRKTRKHYRAFRFERLKCSLEAELQSDHYPPPPMSQVAKKLGYDHSFLYKHLPDLCRAISDRFEKYRTEQCEEKKRLLIREVRQATLEIHSQGIYPSQSRVRNLLAKPGSIRIPEALATWHATLEELGWE